jgi:hypothetical protein
MKNVNFGHGRRKHLGQILPLLAVFMSMLITFAGLALDAGFAYVTKANLSKATDAAAMVGIQNFSNDCLTNQTGCNAWLMAQATFNANYGTPGRETGTPTLTPSFSMYPTVGCPGICLNVTASSTVKTFFIRLLPSFQTVTVSDTAQGLRNPVIMTLVLDRTGSMTVDGGQAALSPAINDFLSYFNDTIDQVALVTFAAESTTDVSMRTGFTSTIEAAVPTSACGNEPCFGGPTFTQGGLQRAYCVETGTTNDSVNFPCDRGITAPTPLANTTPINVVVFFTDGWANMIKETVTNCNANGVGASGPGQWGGLDSSAVDPNGGDGYFYFASPINENNYTYFGYNDPRNPLCSANATFPSQIPNYANSSTPKMNCTNCTITWNGQADSTWTQGNITNEALYRSVQTANALRTAGTYVYAVGLSSEINRTFLFQIANDCDNAPWPAAAQSPDPGLPTACNTASLQGNAAFAPACGTNASLCQTQLNAAFEYIAHKILYRLSQ